MIKLKDLTTLISLIGITLIEYGIYSIMLAANEPSKENDKS